MGALFYAYSRHAAASDFTARARTDVRTRARRTEKGGNLERGDGVAPAPREEQPGHAGALRRDACYQHGHRGARRVTNRAPEPKDEEHRHQEPRRAHGRRRVIAEARLEARRLTRAPRRRRRASKTEPGSATM